MKILKTMILSILAAGSVLASGLNSGVGLLPPSATPAQLAAQQVEIDAHTNLTLAAGAHGGAAGLGGATNFIELLDVPSSYTGQSNKLVSVKATEDGLEFIDAAFARLDSNNTYVFGTTNTFVGALQADFLYDTTGRKMLDVYAKQISNNSDQAVIDAADSSLLDAGGVWKSMGTATNTDEIVNYQTLTNQLAQEQFTSHPDTPASYVGEGGNFVRVNVGETGLEFIGGTNVISIANVAFDADFIPTTSNAFKVGSADFPISELWVASNTVYVGGVPISSDGTRILMDVADTNGNTYVVEGGSGGSTNLSDYNNDAGFLADDTAFFYKDGTRSMTGNFRLGNNWLSYDGSAHGIQINGPTPAASDEGKVSINGAAFDAELNIKSAGLSSDPLQIQGVGGNVLMDFYEQPDATGQIVMFDTNDAQGIKIYGDGHIIVQDYITVGGFGDNGVGSVTALGGFYSALSPASDNWMVNYQTMTNQGYLTAPPVTNTTTAKFEQKVTVTQDTETLFRPLVVGNDKDVNFTSTGIDFSDADGLAFIWEYQRIDPNAGFMTLWEERVASGTPVLRASMADKSVEFWGAPLLNIDATNDNQAVSWRVMTNQLATANPQGFTTNVGDMTLAGNQTVTGIKTINNSLKMGDDEYVYFGVGGAGIPDAAIRYRVATDNMEIKGSGIGQTAGLTFLTFADYTFDDVVSVEDATSGKEAVNWQTMTGMNYADKDLYNVFAESNKFENSIIMDNGDLVIKSADSQQIRFGFDGAVYDLNDDRVMNLVGTPPTLSSNAGIWHVEGTAVASDDVVNYSTMTNQLATTNPQGFGVGDMTLAGSQTVTGSKTFNPDQIMGNNLYFQTDDDTLSVALGYSESGIFAVQKTPLSPATDTMSFALFDSYNFDDKVTTTYGATTGNDVVNYQTATNLIESSTATKVLAMDDAAGTNTEYTEWAIGGTQNTDDNWRIGVVSSNLTIQVRVSGVWTDAASFTRP